MKITKILSAKRYVIYPAIVGFFTFQLLASLQGSAFGDLIYNSGPMAIIEEATGIPMPYDMMKYYFAYAVGFAYGSFSVIFPIHKMGLGILGLGLMLLKYWMCFTVFASMAMFWIPLELLVAGIVLSVGKIMKRKQGLKQAAKIAANVNGLPL